MAHRNLARLEALKRQLVILIGVARGDLSIRHGLDSERRFPHVAAAIRQLNAIARALALTRRIPNGLGAVSRRIARTVGIGGIEVADRRNVRAGLAHDGVQVAVIVAMGLLAVGVGRLGKRRPSSHRIQRLEVGVRIDGRERMVARRAARYALVHVGRIVSVTVQVDERARARHGSFHLVELQFHVHQIAVFPHRRGDHHVARGGDEVVSEQRFQRQASARTLAIGHERDGLAVRGNALQRGGVLRIVVDRDGLQIGHARRIEQRCRQQHLGRVEAELIFQALRARHRTSRAARLQIAERQLGPRVHGVGGVVGDDRAEAGVLFPQIAHRTRADLHRTGGVVVMQRGRQIALVFHLGVGVVRHYRANGRQGHAQDTRIFERLAPAVLALERGEGGGQRHIDVAVVARAVELDKGVVGSVDVLVDVRVGQVQTDQIAAVPGRLVHDNAVVRIVDGKRR